MLATDALMPSATPVTARNTDSRRWSQYLALASVPLLWGTFTPAMKLLLGNHNAPPVIVINLASHAIGAAALALLWSFEGLARSSCLPADDGSQDTSQRSRKALQATAELGAYLFSGQLTQLIGLMGTKATTNAILVQSSVIFVPLLEGLPPNQTCTDRLSFLLPSLLALGGIALITVAPELSGDEGADLEEQTMFGIGCSLAAAFSYAMHTVRLSTYRDVDATIQATGQVVANAALDLVALCACSMLRLGKPPIKWLRSHVTRTGIQPLLWAAVWNGVMIVGATTWAMSYAQRAVRASTAALAYAMEPAVACIFCSLVLDETVGPMEMAGAALVVSANVLAGMRT